MIVSHKGRFKTSEPVVSLRTHDLLFVQDASLLRVTGVELCSATLPLLDIIRVVAEEVHLCQQRSVRKPISF